MGIIIDYAFHIESSEDELLARLRRLRERLLQFYEHRDWSKSAEIVNTETTLARLVGGMIDIAVREARQRGVPIEDISNPATHNYNLVRVRDGGKGRKVK